VCGYSPFADMATNDQMKICKNILRGTVVYPTTCTGALRELIGFLLEKDLKKRLGCLKGGAGDIKRHKFFKRT
jgi:protein kinase X